VRPVLDAGFYSSAERPLHVFICENSIRCPGSEEPGDAACAENLVGQACANCKVGWVWNGKKCSQCTDVEASSFMFPVLPLMLLVALILVRYKMFGDTYEKWGTWQNGMASILFIMLNHYQITTVMRGANLAMPSNVDSAFKLSGWTSDVVTLFQPACGGFGDFQSNMIVQVSIPAVVLVVTFLVWITSQLVERYAKPGLGMDKDRTLNGVLSLMYTFFAGIANMAFSIFKCSPHPNNIDKTLTADRSINCYESDWNNMVVLGVFAVVFWCLGFGSIFTWAILKAPAKFHDAGTRMRWKFLFIKFRADVHWWSLMLVGKGIVMNFGFLVLTSGLWQLYWIQILLMIYTGVAVIYRPWRHILVNCADIGAHMLLILLCGILTWFAHNGGNEDIARLDEMMSQFAVLVTFLCFPCCLIPGFCLIYQQNSKKLKEQKKQKVAAIINATALLGAGSAEERNEFLVKLGEWDFWTMNKAAHVIYQEYAKMRWRSGYSSHNLTRDSPSIPTTADGRVPQTLIIVNV